MGDATETGRRRNGQKGFCGLRSSRRPKATLFTFSFTYIGVSVHQNFVLLPVSVASPLNIITFPKTNETSENVD